jgi:AbrB family looped-hinge helix DNA binding protein
METTRLSTKGQVILPKAVRSARAWLPGTEFVVEETPEGVLLRPIGRLPQSRLEDVAGCLKWTGKPKTIKGTA